MPAKFQKSLKTRTNQQHHQTTPISHHRGHVRSYDNMSYAILNRPQFSNAFQLLVLFALCVVKFVEYQYYSIGTKGPIPYHIR